MTVYRRRDSGNLKVCLTGVDARDPYASRHFDFLWTVKVDLIFFIRRKIIFRNSDDHLKKILSQSSWHCSQQGEPAHYWGLTDEKYDSIQTRNCWRWNCSQCGNANMHLRAVWGDLNRNLSPWKPKLAFNFPTSPLQKYLFISLSWKRWLENTKCIILW